MFGANECFYCMDSHGAFALALMPEASASPTHPDANGSPAHAVANGPAALIEHLKAGDTSGLSSKMRALVDIARTVQRRARDLTRDDVVTALRAGATDADTQLAVLIASAFCMYNRMVDGLRARTPPSPEAYRERASQIAQHGYSDPRVASIPGVTGASTSPSRSGEPSRPGASDSGASPDLDRRDGSG